VSKSVEQLIMTLNKEYEIYEEVLKLAKEKKRVVIDGRIKELDAITRKEQSIIFNLGKIDKVREALTINISKELRIEVFKNVTELSQYLEGDLKDQILEVRDKLVDIVEKVKKANDLNNKLIQQSLEYIEFNKNLLTSMETKGITYGSMADEKEVKTKNNLFDARV
jgi:flagellar biosynthesis/type III secretory pathway chaperone